MCGERDRPLSATASLFYTSLMSRIRVDNDHPDDLTTTEPDAPTEETETSPRSRRHRLWDGFIVLLLLVALAYVGYSEWSRRQTAEELTTTMQKLQELEHNSRASGEAVAREVLAKVGTHIVLPTTSPAPTVATIVNAEELKKDNPFYAPAKNGDHLVITRTRAILYDPAADKILDVVPVQITPASPTPTATPTASPTASPQSE